MSAAAMDTCAHQIVPSNFDLNQIFLKHHYLHFDARFPTLKKV